MAKTAQRPTLFEVAQGLTSLGLTASALDLLRSIGCSEIPAPVVKKAPYQREKQRYAHIHVAVDVDADTQRKLLEGFRETLSKKPEFQCLPACDSDHLLKIVLPGSRVVYSYRVDLALFKTSGLEEAVAKSKHLEAYTRKPRADAQKHCLAEVTP